MEGSALSNVAARSRTGRAWRRAIAAKRATGLERTSGASPRPTRGDDQDGEAHVAGAAVGGEGADRGVEEVPERGAELRLERLLVGQLAAEVEPTVFGGDPGGVERLGDEGAVAPHGDEAMNEVAGVDFEQAKIQCRRRVEDDVGPEPRGLAVERFETLGRPVGGDGEIEDLEADLQSALGRVRVEPVFEEVFIRLVGRDAPAHVDRRAEQSDADDAIGLLDGVGAVAERLRIRGEPGAEDLAVDVGPQLELEEVAAEGAQGLDVVELDPVGGMAEEPLREVVAGRGGGPADAGDQRFVIAGRARFAGESPRFGAPRGRGRASGPCRRASARGRR